MSGWLSRRACCRGFDRAVGPSRGRRGRHAGDRRAGLRTSLPRRTGRRRQGSRRAGDGAGRRSDGCSPSGRRRQCRRHHGGPYRLAVHRPRRPHRRRRLRGAGEHDAHARRVAGHGRSVHRFRGTACSSAPCHPGRRRGGRRRRTRANVGGDLGRGRYAGRTTGCRCGRERSRRSQRRSARRPLRIVERRRRVRRVQSRRR